jgi:hypothetical protein
VVPRFIGQRRAKIRRRGEIDPLWLSLWPSPNPKEPGDGRNRCIEGGTL